MGKKQPKVVNFIKYTSGERSERMATYTQRANEPHNFLKGNPKKPANYTIKVRLLVPEEEKDYLDWLIEEGGIYQNKVIEKVLEVIAEIEHSEAFQAKVSRLNEIDTRISDILGVLRDENTTPEEAELLNKEKADLNEEVKTLRFEQIKLYSEGRVTDYGIKGMCANVDFAPGTPEVIDSSVRKYICAKVFASVDKYLKGQGREIHKKPLRFINSIGYTRVGTRVDLCNNCLVIGPRGGDEHYLALDIEGNDYARSALSQDIRCFEITRSGIGKKRRYFANISIKGKLPAKYDADGNRRVEPKATGKVGVQFDKAGCIAVVGTEIYNFDIGSRANSEKFISKSLRLQRKMSELLMEENPDNYDDKGVAYKSTPERRLVWYHSPLYTTLHERLNRLYEKQANIRKNAHFDTANKLVTLGDQFFTLNTDYAEIMRKKPYSFSLSDKERKRFVKDLGPADAKLKLKWKAQAYGLYHADIPDTDLTCLRFYNHETDTFDKEFAKEEFLYINGTRLYHGAYIAFLLAHLVEFTKGKEQSIRIQDSGKRSKKGNKAVSQTKNVRFQVDLDGIKRDLNEFLENYEALVADDTLEYNYLAEM